MYNYGLMEPGRYYLVREYEHGPIQLLLIMMQTDRGLLLQRYGIPLELEWRLRTDSLHEIIECLSDDQVQQWLYCFRSYEDAYLRSEDGEEDED